MSDQKISTASNFCKFKFLESWLFENFSAQKKMILWFKVSTFVYFSLVPRSFRALSWQKQNAEIYMQNLGKGSTYLRPNIEKSTSSPNK